MSKVKKSQSSLKQTKKPQKTKKPKTNLEVRGSLNKFPDFFCMGTFIGSTHMKL